MRSEKKADGSPFTATRAATSRNGAKRSRPASREVMKPPERRSLAGSSSSPAIASEGRALPAAASDSGSRVKLAAQYASPSDSSCSRGGVSRTESARAAWPVRIAPWVATATKPGASRGTHARSTCGHGASASSRRKKAAQSETRSRRPSAGCQASRGIGSLADGGGESRLA